MQEEYTLQELTPEEFKALNDDMQAVLLKHNAEMQVTSRIELLKRVEVKKEEGIPTPFPLKENDKDTKENTDSETEKSG